MFLSSIISFIKKEKTVIWLLLGAAAAVAVVSMVMSLSSKDRIIRNYRVNEIALKSENDSLKNTSVNYELSLKQLEYVNDSVVDKLNATVKQLNISRSRLKEMQYIETVTKPDTVKVEFRDTLFVDRSMDIDTSLHDDWYSLSMHLKYPNIIEVSPSFKDELHIVTSTRKATVEPAKKFFIARWFQKKYTVLETTVVSENPYTEIRQSKFYNIIDK